jgi:uncharacterized damage-inducible protein DinB
MSTQNALFVKMALDAWETHNKRVDKLLGKLSDEQLGTDTAPGRNSGLYLLGHLVAVNDAMLPLLGLGDRLHPELEEPFLKSADKSGHELPAVDTLKNYWNEINDKLRGHFTAMQPEDWFTRHMSVSPEDFEKEPHRNKLNIILNRTNHQAYHLGQMVYLDPK